MYSSWIVIRYRSVGLACSANTMTISLCCWCSSKRSHWSLATSPVFEYWYSHYSTQHIPLGERPSSADTPSTASEAIEPEIPEQPPAMRIIKKSAEEECPHEKVNLEDFQVQAILGRGYGLKRGVIAEVMERYFMCTIPKHTNTTQWRCWRRMRSSGDVRWVEQR